MSVEPRCEYAPGDPILIRNIVTELKAQGVFDQFRKECISDVDTKPAYQNLCHRVDGQVDTYLSKIRWGTDLSKNQLRDKIRKYVNEFNYVESGITRIVDQLVNPRINTILVPKVENIVYEYLGIPRPVKGASNDPKSPVFDVKLNHFDDKSNDSVSSKSRNNCKTNSINADGQKGKTSDGIFRDKAKTDSVEKCLVNSKSEEIIEQSVDEEAKKEDTRTSLSNIESDEENLDYVETMNENVFEPSARLTENNRQNDEIFEDMSEEDDEDDISPPFEPLVKSDHETSIPSIESNYSPEVHDSSDRNLEPLSVNVTEQKPNDQDAPLPLIETNATVSLDSASTPAPPDIPKTPTVHYETSSSDDNDSGTAKHNPLPSIPPPITTQELSELPKWEPLPDPTNVVKMEEKIVEENRERKEEKQDGGSSRSRHASRDSRHRDHKHHSDRHKRDKERRQSVEKNKDDGKERREEKHEERSRDEKKHKEGSRSSLKHDKDRRDEKKSSGSSSKHHHYHHRRHHSESSRDDEKRRKKSGDSGGEAKNTAKDACSSDQKAKHDRRSSDRDSNGQPPPTSSSSSSGHSHQREKHSDKSRVSSSSSLHHKSKKTDTKKTKNGGSSSKVNNGLKNDAVQDGKVTGSDSKEKKNDKTGSKRRLEQSNRKKTSDRSNESVQKTSDNLMEALELKKPKIARNQFEFGKVVKLRKQLKEKMKLLREKAKRENSEPSVSQEISLNMTRVDTKFKIVEGRCLVNEEGIPRSPLINDDNNNKDENTTTNEIHYTTSDDEEMPLEPEDELGEVNIEEVIGCRTNLARLTIKNEEEKTTFGEHNKENVSINHSPSISIVDGFEYFESSTSEASEGFKKFVYRLLNESLDVQLENFSITMSPYPERYDSIFREQLNAVVERIGQSSVKYNSELINDEGIMLRIKMSHDATKSSSKKKEKQNMASYDERGSNMQLHNGQLTFKSTDEGNVSDSSLSTRRMESEGDEEPSRTSFTKRKTLGIKRKLSKTSPKTNRKTNIMGINIEKNQFQSMTLVGQEETKKCTETNLIASRLSGEIETTCTTNENSSSLCDQTVNSNFTVPSTPLKTQKPPRKVPRRAPNLSNSHYDISDLYKPRLSFLVSSRRSRGMNSSENK